MSVITRTNLSTNPFPTTTTGWAWQLGTGEASAYTLPTDAGPDGQDGYLRRTITTAKTAGNSGAYRNESVSGVTGDDYTSGIWVRSSAAVTVALNVTAKSGATTVTAQAGAATALAAGTWTFLQTTLTNATGAYDNVQSWVIMSATAILPVGATFDVARNILEKSLTGGDYFDGSFVNGGGIAYAWTGTANASTSTATAYIPTMTLVAKTDAPTDRVEITIADLYPAEATVTVYRTVDGFRRPVREGENLVVIGTDAVIDYEAPLGRVITYELEISSGIALGGPGASGTITLTPTGENYGWIQDPLDPASAIKLYGDVGPNGEPALTDQSVHNLAYAADVSLIPIMGSSEPVALIGQRMVASKIPFNILTDAAEHTTTLRDLLMQAPLVLIRPLPSWGSALPGLCYVAPPEPTEDPINAPYGGTLTSWSFETGLVAPPRMKLVVPIWTYGDVQALWATYQQAQTALSGKTYLAVRISPPNGL